MSKVRKSLKVSFWDGVFASWTGGITGNYMTPYALALKATTFQIGALSAIPFLASSLAQLNSADITERIKSKKKTILIFNFVHLLMLIPIMLIPYLFRNNPVLFLILFVTLFTAFNTLTIPVWLSLLVEYIPYRKRGLYFGWRNRIMMIFTICASFLAGFILQYFKNDVLKGFLVIFSLAFVTRLISLYFLSLMHEPRYAVRQEDYFSFLDFIGRIRDSNFAKFVLLVSGLHFCVNLASPFFSVFMLRDLKFNYITYTFLINTVTVVQILVIGRWGRVADKVGNIKVIKFSALLIASLPLWWIISQNPAYLVFAEMLSGFAWAGFNLSVGNFVYDAVSAQKRIRCIGYLSVCTGMTVFLGGMIGGYLAHHLPNIFGYRILTLFLVSSSLRFLIVLSLIGKIKEVRTVEPIRKRDLFYRIIGIKSIDK